MVTVFLFRMTESQRGNDYENYISLLSKQGYFKIQDVKGKHKKIIKIQKKFLNSIFMVLYGHIIRIYVSAMIE